MTANLTTSNSSEKSIPSSDNISTNDPALPSVPHNGANDFRDLEKADTIYEDNGNVLESARASGRISRIQSLTRRNTRAGIFSHPLSHVKTTADVLVDFEGPDDPYMPLNWPLRKKVLTTVRDTLFVGTISARNLLNMIQMLYGLTTMGATLNSSVYSPAINPISQEYHVGTEVSLLGLSLLLAGFGLGPLLWAPLSEIYGRKYAGRLFKYQNRTRHLILMLISINSIFHQRDVHLWYWGRKGYTDNNYHTLFHRRLWVRPGN